MIIFDMEKIVSNCNGCNRNCFRDSEDTKRVTLETPWDKISIPEDFLNCLRLRKIDEKIIPLITN